MINEKNAREFCCEDISLIRGYERAVNDTTQVYDLHHLDGVFYTKEQLISMDMYYKVPAMALLFLTKSEHRKIHCAFNGNGCEGRAVSDKTRRQISEKLKGVSNLNLSKRVHRYTLDGIFVDEYQSTMEAQRILGLDHRHISDCCNGKQKTAYGYVWSYEKRESIDPVSQPKNVQRGICQYTLDGEFVKKWPSLSHIFHSLNYNKGNIYECCNGRRKTAYGYVWCYAD